MADQVRLTEVDASNIGVHARLTPADNCYFIFEYTSGKRYDFSATNNLISNLKKKRGANGYAYKQRAITYCAGLLRDAINADWLAAATLVPAPPSKMIGHPDYDDRIERICRGIGPNIDVRSIVRQTASTNAAHEVAAGERPSVEDLLAVYQIDEPLADPAPRAIGIIDDVLTAGTHFRAISTILGQRFPQVPITGIFMARRVFADDEQGFPPIA